MRVTVTGGRGFLGSHLVTELENHGHHVFAPSRHQCDLMTESGRRNLFAGNPEAVIHAAAAVGGIGANAAEPGRFFYENASMGIELMELARKSGVKKFVTIGTTCEFPDSASQPLCEEHIWEGNPPKVMAPYGLAKRALLEMGIAYRDQYGFNAVHLLPTNLYGPGDNFDLDTGHVIPSLIRKFVEANGGPVTLWGGSGSVTRDFLYVTDAARMIRIALEEYDLPGPLNLGSSRETTINQVAGLIKKVLGSNSEIRWDASKPEGVQRRVLDTTTARAFGIEATTSLLQGLRKTIEWYLGN